LSVFSQPTKKGYGKMKWGTSKSKIAGLQNCNVSFVDAQFTTCGYNESLSFVPKIVPIVVNLRFFENELMEIGFDVKRGDLEAVVANYTKEYGEPDVKESLNSPKPIDDLKVYTWQWGKTEITLLDKGYDFSLWINIYSLAIRKKAYFEPQTLADKLIK
jgi:hypothetical protein